MDIPPNKIGSKASISCYKKDPWLDFFERNLFSIKAKTPEERYYKLMKQGHNKHYWLEYVFVSFVNFTSDMILLSGIPDKPETLAHHQDNSEIVC